MEEQREMSVLDSAPQEEETVSIEAGSAPAEREAHEHADGEGTTPPLASEETTPKKDGGEIVYRFNHETRTLDADAAPDFIQKLLKSQYDYEHKVVPQLDRLRRLTGADEQDLAAVVEQVEQVCDEAEYRRFLEQCGGNETIARGLQQVSRKAREQKANTTAVWAEKRAEEEKQTLTERMADQLYALQAEFPDIRELAQLPESVVAEASEQGISLLDGYLRYLHRNSLRAAAQENKQEKAAAAGVGSLRGEPDTAERTDAQASAFSAAFRKRFL